MAIQWQIWTRTQITSFLVQCVSTNQITSVLCSYTLLYNPLVLNENLAFCFCSHQLLQGMCLQSSTSKMQLKFLFLYEASEPTRVFFLSLPSSPQHLITIYAFFFFLLHCYLTFYQVPCMNVSCIPPLNTQSLMDSAFTCLLLPSSVLLSHCQSSWPFFCLP